MKICLLGPHSLSFIALAELNTTAQLWNYCPKIMTSSRKKARLWINSGDLLITHTVLTGPSP
jgi:hypothetical protein